MLASSSNPLCSQCCRWNLLAIWFDQYGLMQPGLCLFQFEPRKVVPLLLVMVGEPIVDLSHSEPCTFVSWNCCGCVESRPIKMAKIDASRYGQPSSDALLTEMVDGKIYRIPDYSPINTHLRGEGAPCCGGSGLGNSWNGAFVWFDDDDVGVSWSWLQCLVHVIEDPYLEEISGYAYWNFHVRAVNLIMGVGKCCWAAMTRRIRYSTCKGLWYCLSREQVQGDDPFLTITLGYDGFSK